MSWTTAFHTWMPVICRDCRVLVGVMIVERAEHMGACLHHNCRVRIGVFAAELAGHSGSIHWQCELGDVNAADLVEYLVLFEAKEKE